MDNEARTKFMEMIDKLDDVVNTEELMAMDEVFFIPTIMAIMKEYELRHKDFCMVTELLSMLDMEITMRGRNTLDFLKFVVASAE